MACGWTATSPERPPDRTWSAASGARSSEAGLIQLRVPALPAFGGLAPLTASGLAERIGFAPAEIERLCQAIDCTVAALVEPFDYVVTHDRDHMIEVQFTVQPHRLTVQLDAAVTPLPAERWGALAHRLSGLVTSFEAEGGRAMLSLTAEPGEAVA